MKVKDNEYNFQPTVNLNPVEIRSKISRLDTAEALIQKFQIENPEHEGAKTWLMNYGKGEYSKQLRLKKGLEWVKEFQCAEWINAGLIKSGIVETFSPKLDTDIKPCKAPTVLDSFIKTQIRMFGKDCTFVVSEDQCEVVIDTCKAVLAEVLNEIVGNMIFAEDFGPLKLGSITKLAVDTSNRWDFNNQFTARVNRYKE